MEALRVIAVDAAAFLLITRGTVDWRDSPLQAGISAPRLVPSRDLDGVSSKPEEPSWRVQSYGSNQYHCEEKWCEGS